MPGVYEIADEAKRIIYIGQSGQDVPGRLRQHLASGSCVALHAQYWRWSYSRTPKAEEADQLAVYISAHGELPPCNRATQKVRDADRRLQERFSSKK